MWGPFLTPGKLSRTQIHREPGKPDAEPEHPHLRSTQELRGYRFQARDGDIGHIEDYIGDDPFWSVKYLGIDTRNGWPGAIRFLLAREWIREVSWHEKAITTGVTRQSVQEAPEKTRNDARDDRRNGWRQVTATFRLYVPEVPRNAFLADFPDDSQIFIVS